MATNTVDTGINTIMLELRTIKGNLSQKPLALTSVISVLLILREMSIPQRATKDQQTLIITNQVITPRYRLLTRTTTKAAMKSAQLLAQDQLIQGTQMQILYIPLKTQCRIPQS
jgi:hypothetical protein